MPKPLILTADATVPGSGGATPPAGAEPAYQWERHGALRSRVLEVDPVLNKTTTYWYDSHTHEQFVTDTWHDINPILERSQALRNATDDRARWSPVGDGEEVHLTHVAHFPVALIPDIMAKTGNGKDRNAVSRWMKDPANEPFLVRRIRLGV